MTWFKLDDQFPSHPKVMRAGTEAAWLFVAGGCYCGQYLTDGLIPKAKVSSLTALKSPPRLAAKLVEVGLWHDRGDEYEVHDYLKYNPAREKVLAERDAAAARRKKGGKTSADVRATFASPGPVPDVPSEHRAPSKRRTGPPKDFVPTIEHARYADQNALDLHLERENWLTHCEAHGTTYASVNAGFTTWLHKSVQFGNGGKLTAVIAPVLGIVELGDPVGRLEDRKCPLNVCDGSGNLDYDGRPHGTPVGRCECTKARTV